MLGFSIRGHASSPGSRLRCLVKHGFPEAADFRVCCAALVVALKAFIEIGSVAEVVGLV